MTGKTCHCSDAFGREKLRPTLGWARAIRMTRAQAPFILGRRCSRRLKAPLPRLKSGASTLATEGGLGCDSAYGANVVFSAHLFASYWSEAECLVLHRIR